MCCWKRVCLEQGIKFETPFIPGRYDDRKDTSAMLIRKETIRNRFRGCSEQDSNEIVPNTA
ncbi:AAEL011426-PA [Aedes aegypti]|uniref:AAEL011426-PA n=1 Tax=Aedes aegypti TaxID=7159 RepID=Q0IEC3_AEDAE|nr:AAEL011426-PA [Aedes aegypti]